MQSNVSLGRSFGFVRSAMNVACRDSLSLALCRMSRRVQARRVGVFLEFETVTADVRGVQRQELLEVIAVHGQATLEPTIGKRCGAHTEAKTQDRNLFLKPVIDGPDTAAKLLPRFLAAALVSGFVCGKRPRITVLTERNVPFHWNHSFRLRIGASETSHAALFDRRLEAPVIRNLHFSCERITPGKIPSQSPRAVPRAYCCRRC